ncbi:hypothetical protein ACFWYW_46625 [Nonomuraea sp. NPDC059023]|uniref:hypothetical protein n=1 Tax=unclassified Nonomuraea TaxID=2593643 RepID=UPI00367E6BC0
MSSEAITPLFEVEDPADPDTAARLLTARYASGADRQMWESEGVTLPPEQAVLAVLADPSPGRDALVALVALVPRGRQVWDLYEYIGMSLARGLDEPVRWETLGRAAGTSKQAAQQRFERRHRDSARLEARRPDYGRPRPSPRAWLDEHAAELRAAAAVLLAHHGELIAISPEVAVVVHRLGVIHYMLGDAEVLDGVRQAVAAVRREQTQREDDRWGQLVLSERAWAALARVEHLLGTQDS